MSFINGHGQGLRFIIIVDVSVCDNVFVDERRLSRRARARWVLEVNVV